MNMEQSYREYAAELMMYATFLVGPVEAGSVFADAWNRLVSLQADGEGELTRRILYRQVYAAAGEGHRERTSRRLEKHDHAPPVQPSVPAAGVHDQLSVDQRAMVYLTDGLGLRPSLVASQLGLPVPLIQRGVSRARAKLDQHGTDRRALIQTVVASAPPVPEYGKLARRQPGRGGRLRSPRLLWGATSLAVVFLLVPLLVQGSGPSTVVVTTTATTVPPGAVPFAGTVYLAQAVDGADVLALVAFEVAAVDETGTLEPDDDPIAFLTKMTDLSVRLPSSEDEDGQPTIAFFSMVPSGTRIEERSTVEWQGRPTLVLDMHSDFISGSGMAEGDVAMLGQLVYTATAVDPNQLVWFTVGGEPIEEFGAEGIDISTPIGRETFRDQLNPILVDKPVVVDVSSQLITVAGQAMSESGEVAYAVDRTNAASVVTGTASTGCAGCWGAYSFTISAASMVPGGFIALFEAGADGRERLHQVEVFMPAGFDGRWSLSD